MNKIISTYDWRCDSYYTSKMSVTARETFEEYRRGRVSATMDISATHWTWDDTDKMKMFLLMRLPIIRRIWIPDVFPKFLLVFSSRIKQDRHRITNFFVRLITILIQAFVQVLMESIVWKDQMDSSCYYIIQMMISVKNGLIKTKLMTSDYYWFLIRCIFLVCFFLWLGFCL
jgi:hypothetical protein